MKKKIYNFKRAIKIAEEWYMPTELSSKLKDAALKISVLSSDETAAIAQLHEAVLNACEFLDAIEVRTYEVKEVAQ